MRVSAAALTCLSATQTPSLDAQSSYDSTQFFRISTTANIPALFSGLSAGLPPVCSAISQPVSHCSVVKIKQGYCHWLTQNWEQDLMLSIVLLHHQTSSFHGFFISLMLCRVMASLAKCTLSSLIRSAKSDQSVSSATLFIRGDLLLYQILEA